MASLIQQGAGNDYTISSATIIISQHLQRGRNSIAYGTNEVQSLLLILGCSIFCLAATTVVNLATQVSGLLAKTNGGTGNIFDGDLSSLGNSHDHNSLGTTAIGTSAIASGACATVAATATGTTT